jgi:hypothetical protein
VKSTAFGNRGCTAVAARALLAGAGFWLAALAPAAEPAGALATPAKSQKDAQELVEDLGRDYPPGSIITPLVADHALVAARTANASLQAQFDTQRRKCAGVFFVNRCLDAARRSQRAGEHVVRRVTIEAHDLQRHRDADLHAKSRAQAIHDQAADELLRPERERQAALNARTREQNASAREADEQRDLARAAQDSATAEARARTHEAGVARKDAARPGEEAAASLDYRQKQDQAAAYAKTRGEDRDANAKRRAEREKARAAQAAADHRAAAAAVPSTAGPKP